MHNVIEEWTGIRPMGCPWAAFSDPRVLRAVRACAPDVEAAWAEPDPSNWLVEAVMFYRRMLATVRGKRREQEREQPRVQARPGTEVLRG